MSELGNIELLPNATPPQENLSCHLKDGEELGRESITEHESQVLAEAVTGEGGLQESSEHVNYTSTQSGEDAFQYSTPITASTTTAVFASTTVASTTDDSVSTKALSSSVPCMYDPLAALQELDENMGDRENIFRESQWRRPTTLQFEGVSFSVGEKVILRNVSGAAQPGQVVAIMGPSGAGKTTLLDILAGRVVMSGPDTSISGVVRVNGEARDFNTFRKVSAYVLQSDIFFPELTVRETIMLSALLRLPKAVPYETKIQRVNLVWWK